MIYSKMTRGWVAQQYDSETGDCVSQQFMPDDAPAQRVYQNGSPIAPADAIELENTEKPCPLDMVQP